MNIQKKNFGFTLIEIILAVTFLAIFGSIVLRIYWDWFDKPALDKTTQDILMIKNGMKLYKLDNGFYPTTEQGIQALVTKPTSKPIPEHWTQHLKEIPIDQWGKPYHYINSGKQGEIEVYR